MPIFAIYKYRLSRVNEGGDLFAAEMAAEKAQLPKYDAPEDCFGSFFSTSVVMMPVVKTSGKGVDMTRVIETYRGDVSAERNGVIMLTLENNKEKHTIVDKKDVEHEHHPFCHIIIDNRKDRHIIAIEKSPAFDSKPEKARAIIDKAMNDKLRPYGIEMDLRPLHRKEKSFWSVVDELRTRFDDTVTQVRMDFKGKDETQDPKGILAILTSMAKKAESMAAMMLYAEDGEVKLENIQEDLNHIADICVKEKAYDLVVKFKKFGMYRFGSDIMAQFGVEDETIEKFESGEKELSYNDDEGCFALTNWLDRMSELLNDYEDEAPVKTKRKRSHRR